jgi:uncharacterized membrane protein YccC
MTAAGVLSFALAELLALPQGYWAVFTAVLVTQASLGGSVKATMDRLIGTIGGAACAAVVSSLIPHDDLLALGLALAVTLAPLTLVAAINPSFRVAPITAIILLLAGTNAHVSPIVSALDRVLEITIGGLVGLAVSLFVLPARAHSLVAEAAGRLLGFYAALLSALLEGAKARPEPAQLQRLRDGIRARSARLEAVAEEAGQERRSRLTEAPDPEPLLRTLRRIRHDLVMIGRAVSAPLPEPVRARLAPPLARVAAAACDFLRGTGEALTAGREPPALDAAPAALASYAGAMEAMRHDHATLDLSGDAAARIFALGFGLEQLGQNFADLRERVVEFTPESDKGSR